MKLRATVVVFAVLVLFSGLYFFWPGTPVKFEITEGMRAGQVAAALKQKGIIHSAAWFKVLVKLSGTGKRIMPGEYGFRTYMSAEEVLWKLVNNTYSKSARVVIPEGWRMEQIAERLAANGITRAEDFLAEAKKQNAEGYLFPSTYDMAKNTNAKEVINLLKSEFDRNIRPLFSEGFPRGLDERKVLVIASIVEREAAEAVERPLIAAVYLNRHKKGMPLEADPTVQYSLGYWKKGLTYKDLKFKSPYNTYVVKGLPPGPICNPGYDSVLAVMKPADIDALYFVADRKGKHVFNLSFKEHIKAKQRIERESRASAN